MAEAIEDDPEIGSLNAHSDGEPPQAIVATAGQAACDVKPHVIAVLPSFHGKSYEGPYEFLHEFCKICKAQNRPAGSSEDDYRLKALPFVLKGEANTWFMRLPPNSIRTWADFKLTFLDQFFPSTKTSALKKEILGVTQDYNETLSEYWARYMSLLDACPNHRMSEAEIYSTFYEGMNKETKDLANSSSRGGFPHLRVSEAKRIMGKLLSAKRAYDSPCDSHTRRGVASASAAEKEDKLEMRMDKLEKAILIAIEKNAPSSPVESKQVTDQGNQSPNYGHPEGMDDMAQVNAAGHWNPNGNWNPGRQRDAPWRDHPNFRWGDGNQNQYNPPQNNYRGPSTQDHQPNWSGRNQQGQNQHPNQNPQNPNQGSTYVPPHQRNYPNFPNQSQSSQSTHHYQNQPNSNQDQQQHQSNQFCQYQSHQNQPSHSYHQNSQNFQPNPNAQYNPHSQQNPNQFQNPNRQRRSMEDMMGEMLASQQHMRNDLQSNNEVVQGMQNAQKEHKANMDMMNKQLSQLANSMSEMKGNSGRLPSTVHIPEKANVSKITLRSGTSYQEPEMKVQRGGRIRWEVQVMVGLPEATV